MRTLELIGKQSIVSNCVNIKDWINILPTALYWVDDKGIIQHYNKMAAELWGRFPIPGDTDEKFCGAYKLYALNGEHLPHDKIPMAHVLKKGVSVKDEEVLIERPDGTKVIVNVNISPVYDKNGRLLGAINCFQDVTYRKEAGEILEKKNKELSKINNDMDDFIYTASHDLKAPVSNIEGLVDTLKDLLKEKKVEDGDINSVLTMIDASVSRFGKTVRSLTEISKVQKNVQEDVYGVEVFDIVQDVCFDVNYLISESAASIQIDTSACPVIRFSKKNLRSVVYNLISNAVKYRSPLRQPIIEIRTYVDGVYSVLEVKDNGLGINEAYKYKIFAMFKRLHDHTEGDGIGLYIVKRMVDNAEGKIEVNSEEGVGSTFRILFKNNFMH